MGLLIGRCDLADRAVVRAVARLGALLAVPGLIVLVAEGGIGSLDVAKVQGPIEPVAALVSTAGLCLLVLAACLRLVPNEAGRWSPLVIAGGMPLSAYVGHALLFPLLARVTDWGLGVATAVAVAYLVGVVSAATAWRRRHGSGPVEALMRRASGQRRASANESRPPRSRPR